MGANLDKTICVSEAQTQPFINLIAAKNQAKIRSSGQFSEYPHQYGNLKINPLYKEKERGNDKENIYLELNFPSQFYLSEQPQMMDYLPQQVRIPKDLFIDLNKNSHIVNRLISQCVLIDLPSNYS
ncbi:MAG: hypothetical protein JRH03_00130 [Deltaproteobacteria bacterium]|nr:hypothetical protein [Deltaproteobacteria bacterium]